MKLRHTITAAAITVASLAGVATVAPATAGADTSTQATTPEAVVQFWDYMYGLQTTTDTCTAYHSNIVGNGEGGGINPVVNTPLYEGNCLQAFLLVLFNDATYFGYDGHPS